MLRIQRVINESSQLNEVCVSCTRPEDDDRTFATTEHWKVLLHPDQTVPGAQTFDDVNFGHPLEWRAKQLAPSTKQALIEDLFASLSIQPGVSPSA